MSIIVIFDCLKCMFIQCLGMLVLQQDQSSLYFLWYYDGTKKLILSSIVQCETSAESYHIWLWYCVFDYWIGLFWVILSVAWACWPHLT